MSTTIGRSTSETSVTFSLAELAKLEEERVREQEAAIARARETRVREERDAEARRKEAEARDVAAAADARSRRAREEVEEQARVEARKQAEVQVARIAAEAKARLEADNASRAHELALSQVKADQRARGMSRVLGAALGVVIVAAGALTFGLSQKIDRVERDVAELRGTNTALAGEHERAMTSELQALDIRLATMRVSANSAATEEARAAQAARSAIDDKAPDQSKMNALASALDAWHARAETLDRVAALDRRRADVATWAADRKRADVLAKVDEAAARAKAAGAATTAVKGYEEALDSARAALASTSHGRGTGGIVVQPKDDGRRCDGPGDPMCDINGKPL